ncbi:MAG: flagellar basal body-associated FliL family protein [Fibromonadaceae bacterium]|jgi:flagellar FliL protein|nr:flagellar basal body-associated FliL family protein [Fibromonadaceae bacterium]
MALEEERKTEENDAAAEPGANSGKKAVIIKWAIVGVILLLFIGIEVGISMAAIARIKEEDPADTQKQEAEAEKLAELKAQTSMGATLAAPIELTVNISGEEGRYLKCGVQLEYDPSYENLGVELEARKARMKDIIIDIMSSRPLSDLMTNDGKKSIREQIVAEINTILPETAPDGKPMGKVLRSYFDSFIMQ